MKYSITLLFLILFSVSLLFGGNIKGVVKDAQTGDPLIGANITLEKSFLGTTTDMDGAFILTRVPDGEWVMKVEYLGYEKLSTQITVSAEAEALEIALTPTVFKGQEIVIEASRAKDRETPVAFTNIGASEIEQRFTVQDVPHLFKNTPGVYVTSDGGSGLGDSKTFIRGFDEQRISVMINGIEVNDPESKKVYWSNWGSLPSGSQSIQVQRGAGSTLYGAGTFGGSINVLTQDAIGKKGFAFNASYGSYYTSKFGMEFNSGLMKNKYGFIGKVNYLTGNGWRQDTYYRGLQYYFAFSYYPAKKHTLRAVLHGAPQYHAYSYFSFLAKDLARYGRDYNPHPYVNRLDPDLTDREKDGTKLAELLFLQHNDKDKGGEVIGNGNISFDNNVYHKPQLELHHTWDISKKTYLQTTFFGTVGRGYGENINAYYMIGRDNAGKMGMSDIIASGQYQYRAYSIHNQAGLVTTLNTIKWGHEFSFGGEARYWKARHYGLITNTFGQESIGYRIGGETGQFREGDVYYDYTGTKPNYSVFGHALWKFGKLSVMTDLQGSIRKYNIKEDMPSSNNRPDPNGTYHVNQNCKGGNNDGYVNIPDTTYSLLDFDKTYTFLSPKFGVNYNLTNAINAFANVSLVYNEPRVKYFFNYGQPNDDLDIEKSTDFEFGLGYVNPNYNAKLNLYQINFENKAFRIQNPAMVNKPGYDYKGRRYIPVGSACYRGVELSGSLKLLYNLELGTAVTIAKNKWLDDVSKEAQDELGIEEGNIEPEFPQQIFVGTLNYITKNWYASLAVRHNRDYYILPSNEDIIVEYDIAADKAVKESNTLPAWTLADIILGYKVHMSTGGSINLSLHINNIFDEEFFQIGNEYGLLPGAARNIMLNMQFGM